MKNYIVKISFAILLLLPLKTMAIHHPDYVINSEGVEIPLETYFNFQKLYSDAYIDTMTQEDYNRIINLGIDFDNVEQEVKYFKTEYNNVTGATINTEISEQEFIAIDPEEEYSPQATIVETTYKKIVLNVVKSGYNTAYFTFGAFWKLLPSTRSYDVIAARFTGFTKVNGTQSGKQFYTLNGTTNYIQYSFNGTNINNQSNGFGISMNLVNSAVTSLECEIESSMIINEYPAMISASYQHATSNVTLADSKNYTLNAGGLGNVIVFNNNIGYYYDGMQGTYAYIYS